MADITIKKGFDIKLAGKPSTEIADALDSSTVSVQPGEISGIKVRLAVKEGDIIKRNAVLFSDKRDDAFTYRSPAAGVVKEIVRGERRFPTRIVIKPDGEDREELKSFSTSEIGSLSREDAVAHLQSTGMLALIRQRPFSKMASATQAPKSIFVNAMATAPHQCEAAVALQGQEDAFEAGLAVLSRLTEGAVHLCIASSESASVLTSAKATVHRFSGPHPSGNTSVHIANVDPMKPTDIIWFTDAQSVALIGRLFLDGNVPDTKVIALGGNGVKEAARQHYRVKIGGELGPFLKGKLEDGTQRVISGDVLSGEHIQADAPVRLCQSTLTVIPESKERRFLGWMVPGKNLLSYSRAYLSGWFGGDDWKLNTNTNGGHRALVLTGYYDKVMPLNILTDYLVRACLANDSDEAIKLGILETAPEDFALCEFICPCKTNVQAIIQDGLNMVEEEGI